MASIGINIARDGSSSPDLVRSLGCTWVRIVAMPDVDLTGYFGHCRALGLQIMLVLARESGGDYAAYQRRYGTLIDALQVGNEPDIDSPSSWTMSPVELASLGRSARQIFWTLPIVAAGLASGQPDWLTGMDLGWADALAFHPYGKRPSPDWPSPDWGTGFLGDLVDGYATIGKPLIVSEIGLSTDEVSEELQAEYLRRCFDYLNQRGDVEMMLWFCLSDTMV